MAKLALASAMVYAVATLVRPTGAYAEENSINLARNPVAIKECSECHAPFSPVNLPATSWKKIFASLDNHFGEDASLAPAVLGKVSKYYLSHAGRAGKAGLRITKTIWFNRAHREAGPRMRKRAGKMSNCLACHTVRKRRR